MFYETIKTYDDARFKRCTGVRRATFDTMLDVVTIGWRSFGRPCTLSRADQLVLTLMYWREYRTEFHIGVTYGVSEATVCRTIQTVESLLIQSEQFHLPKKHHLLHPETEVVVVVDATEQPIERPKKTAARL